MQEKFHNDENYKLFFNIEWLMKLMHDDRPQVPIRMCLLELLVLFVAIRPYSISNDIIIEDSMNYRTPIYNIDEMIDSKKEELEIDWQEEKLNLIRKFAQNWYRLLKEQLSTVNFFEYFNEKSDCATFFERGENNLTDIQWNEYIAFQIKKYIIEQICYSSQYLGIFHLTNYEDNNGIRDDFFDYLIEHCFDCNKIKELAEDNFVEFLMIRIDDILQQKDNYQDLESDIMDIMGSPFNSKLQSYWQKYGDRIKNKSYNTKVYYKQVKNNYYREYSYDIILKHVWIAFDKVYGEGE